MPPRQITNSSLGVPASTSQSWYSPKTGNGDGHVKVGVGYLPVSTPQCLKKMLGWLCRSWRGLPSCRRCDRQWAQRQVEASEKQVKAFLGVWVDSIATKAAFYFSYQGKLCKANYMKFSKTLLSHPPSSVHYPLSSPPASASACKPRLPRLGRTLFIWTV